MKPDRRVGPYGVAVFDRPPRSLSKKESSLNVSIPIILIHGTMDRAASFAKVIRRLPEFHVIRYDRRGYGTSRVNDKGELIPTAHSLEDQITDLFQVMGDARSVLIGHSMGGAIAVAAAAKFPDLVAAIAAYESPLPFSDRRTDSEQPVLPESTTAEDEAEYFMRRMIGDAQWERLPRLLRQKRRSEGFALLADRTVWHHRPEGCLSDISVPVIAAYGDQSTNDHQRAALNLAAGVPNGSTVVIKGASHGAHITHPDDFAALVRKTVALTEPVIDS